MAGGAAWRRSASARRKTDHPSPSPAPTPARGRTSPQPELTVNPILKRVLAVIAGVVVAVLLVSLSDALVARLYPLPAGTEISDVEGLPVVIEAMPIGAMLMLVTGWALAAGIGAFVAVRLSEGRPAGVGLIVAGVILLATVANLVMLPHPVWMWPAALLLVPLFGWVGARAGAGAEVGA